MKTLRILILAVLGTLFMSEPAVSANSAMPSDSARSGIQAFLKAAECSWSCSEGMFKTYRSAERCYWQIPDSLLKRDILVTMTIIKGSARQARSINKYGYGGDMLPGGRMVRLVRDAEDISMQEPYCYPSVASTDAIYKAWSLSQDTPELARFKILAEDKGSVLIDVTSLLLGNHVLFSLSEFPGILDVGSLRSSDSRLTDIRGFADNILISFERGHQGRSSSRRGEDTGRPSPTRWEVAVNFSLLPKEPLKIRYSDPRVGYFTSKYKNYSENPYGAESLSTVRRWRLEPKPEDEARYTRGELVEPACPIVFYIERTTPDYLVPYFIKAVNAWQKPFECAGFKSAIVAKLAPAEDEDPDFSIADTRHSVISYKASTVQNAYGPMIVDPRSGEIICSHVGVFHGVIEMVSQWYFSQCGAVGPAAMSANLPDSVVGELLQMVLTHEIGHTLGLMHNFGGSSVYSVDQLRDKDFVHANSTGNSIMDYIRFNYVTQPEDGMLCSDLIPKISHYDNFAIEWGYRWFPALNAQQEQSYLTEWVTQKQQDLRYWFGSENDAYDPRKQQDDLSSDAVAAGVLGVKNLRSIMEQRQQWMVGESGKRRYESMKRQFGNYITHVTKNIGGLLTQESERGHISVPKEQQQRAVEFLADNVFEAPLWLWQTETTDGMSAAKRVYASLLDELMSKFKSLSRSGSEYRPGEYIQDLHKAIFPASTTEISPYRRCLQRLYVDKLKEVMESDYLVGAYLFEELRNIKDEMEHGANSENYRREMSIHIDRLLNGII